MREINQLFDNYIVKYARDMIKHQRMIKAFVGDIERNIACIDYEMQNVHSVDLSSVKVKSQQDREHFLISLIEEKEQLENTVKCLKKQIKKFDKCLIDLDDQERKVIEYELETMPIITSRTPETLGMPFDEINKKEASALLKIGYKLLEMND